MDDLLVWLRATIEGDKAAAEEFDGEAWTALKDGEQGFILASDGPATGKNRAYFGLAYCYGLGGEAGHMARHDPRDTIARCEVELLLLDEHPVTHGWDGDRHISPICQTCSQATQDGDQEGDPYPCRRVRLLAYGYRHRDGYREEWKP